MNQVYRILLMLGIVINVMSIIGSNGITFVLCVVVHTVLWVLYDYNQLVLYRRKMNYENYMDK